MIIPAGTQLRVDDSASVTVSGGVYYGDDPELATIRVDCGPPGSWWGRLWYRVRWLPWRILGRPPGRLYTVVVHDATTFIVVAPRSILREWWARSRRR